MDTIEIWLDGTFQVLILRDGRYEARVRFGDSTSVRIGHGSTPGEALHDALN